MSHMNKANESQGRLSAVRRKTELYQSRPPVHGARGRRARASSTATTYHQEQTLTDAELELAVRHFDDQHLDPEEAESLSSAILQVIYHGGTRAVSPVGRRQRHYAICRETDGISLRAGEGRILLAPTSARQLAARIRISCSAHVSLNSA